MALTKEQLLAEVEDLLRTMPDRATIRHDTTENLGWLGRVSAVIEKWDGARFGSLQACVSDFHCPQATIANQGLRRLLTLLHQARQDLRMETLGPLNIAVGHGMTFDYFDELRKIIEVAKDDLFFADPYLDAEFVSRYLGFVQGGVTTRLLARSKLQSLLPAVDAFSKQSKLEIRVRSAPNFHDRYIFVDKSACYQSGASFKDGAKTAPTTLTQITDAFPAMWQTYEDLWNKAKHES